MNDRTRIAVLGAGPMGLAVAYQLALDGHQPVVFEADDRVGGMTATFDFGGLDIERYYHFHCILDHAFLQVLDKLGLADRMRWRIGGITVSDVVKWAARIAGWFIVPDPSPCPLHCTGSSPLICLLTRRCPGRRSASAAC